MEEAILSPIVEQIIGTLSSAAVGKIRSLWNVEADLDDLEKTIESVKAVLIDAQKRQIREAQVRDWYQRLEDVVYLADDLLDKISTEDLERQLMKEENVEEKVCIFFSCFNQQAFRIFFSCFDQVAFRHEMAWEIKVVRSELNKIAADKERFHFVTNEPEEVTNDARKSGRETWSFVPRETVIGRDGDKAAILKLLLETNTHGEIVSVIPIVGMGGLGKTTLAQLVFNDESVQRHFDPKIWVCVSDFFDEKLIIEKMLKIAFDMDTKDLELEQLQNKLREKLIGKRYLLVLDDVWNENPEKWNHLKGLLMSFAEGSRIIVTTRSQKVAGVMKTGIKPYDLEILDLHNSWSLFRKLAFDQGVEQINSATEEVGKKIVEKCGGIPLAISMIGSMLCHRNPETDWPFFLQNELSNIFQEENKILPILKLSYDCLPSHLKHCIAYCRLFPKDYVIDVQRLVRLWIAQGFIKSSNRSQSMEEIGYRCFMELLWRSFFQEDERDKFDKVKRCKMHDLVHDLAIQVAGGEYAMLKLGERSIDKRVRHVSFEFSLSSVDQIPSSLLQAKRLRSILLPNQETYDIEGGPGDSICDLIVSNFKFLRMLDLHGLGIKNLSDPIGKLKHLRYLDLSDNVEMKALPTCITELVNLQTLKLNKCKMLNELPRDIKRLVNLRHLELHGCHGIRQMPRGLGDLTNLQTLSKFVVTNLESRGSELDELEKLNNLSGMLYIKGLRAGLESKGANLKEKQNLRILLLIWDGGDENDELSSDHNRELMTIEGLQPHPNLRELTLVGYKGVTLSSWLPSLTNLVILELRNCRKCQQLPSLSQLSSLKIMKLKDLRCLEYVTKKDVDVGGTNFWTSLQELEMRDLPELKGWWRLLDDVAENQVKLPSFPHLSKLTISNCPELTCMPLYPSVEYLKLSATSWKTFEKTGLMSALKAEDQVSSSSSSAVVSSSPLSKLTDLQLDNVVGMPESLPNWMKSLTSLKKLRIEKNSKLKYLSPGIQYLTSLEKFSILNCKELIEISNGDSINWEARDLTFLNQQNLVTLPEGPLLLTNLVNLELKECRKCRHLPPLSHLPSLKKMTLCNLDSLEYITNEDVDVGGTNFWKSLQELDLKYLPSLKGWWRLPAENQVKLPSFPLCLSRLNIQNCPKLTCMPLYVNVKFLYLGRTSWKTLEETALKAEDEPSSSVVVSSSSLSKLRHLLLRDVVDVPESLPNWMKGLTSLKKLQIEKNSKLKYLSPGIQYLTSLQELKIEDCKELIEICNGDLIEWAALSSLRTLSFQQQPNLVTLPEGLQRATTLQSLTIKGCDNFTAIPDWICELCSLTKLYLQNCPNLKSLPASISSLTSLQTLSIEFCPTLSERCKRPTGVDWHKIQHIPDLNI